MTVATFPRTTARLLRPDPARRYECFPLTDMQQAYWIGRNDGFEMGNVSCHLYVEVDVEGLDVSCLEHAWNQLVVRHDMLRAVVHPDGQQQILPEVPQYRIAVMDLRALSAEEIEHALQDSRTHLSHQILQPSQWPLFELRVSLLPGSSRLHVSIDGLLADGWSAMILFRELAQRYLSPKASVPALDVCFRDYVLALPRVAETAAYARSLAYWRRRVAMLPPSPQLPLAMDPGTIRRPVFVRHTTRLEASLWHQLTDCARAVGLSPVSLLIAAYAETLAAFSASPHLMLNIPRYNRLPLHPQVRDLIGNFSTFDLLETHSQQQQSFVDRARHLQAQFLEDLSNDHVGGIAILRDLARTQGIGARAAMPVVFTSLLNMRSDRGNFLTGDLGKLVYIISQTPQVWLDCQVYEDSGALEIAWDAVDTLFPENLLDSMQGAYRDLLQRLAENPRTWQEVPRLIPAAQLSRRAKMNATGDMCPAPLLHELFAEQVARCPSATAVINGQQRLSYGELDMRANALGRTLREDGVLPNTLVAIVMHKGWEQVVGVMAVLKSGAAYLPVDPDLPEDRFRYLLTNGEVRIALTQPHLLSGLPWPKGMTVLAVDAAVPRQESAAPLPTVQGERDLSYVIYTSGSTGQPKGVMIEHRSVVNAILYANQRCGVGSADRVLALTSLHHDLSVYDLFGSLAAGAAMVIPHRDHVRDPAHWIQLIQSEDVSVWNTVPAMMEMLVEYAEGQHATLPRCLRAVILGGDWIPVSLPGRIRRLFPDAQINSIGGPTETTIWNIWYAVVDVAPEWKSIPYGRPIHGNRYYVLNADLEDCPDWVPGELCCAGVGLARGYWRDDEKTRAKFFTHPRTGEYLYRTGDLGRYLPDGNIEFLGRHDFQVKLRGQRIELGGIESVLLQHPGVRAAAVVIAGTGAALRLAAFVVPSEQGQPPVPVTAALVDAGATLTDPLERTRFKLDQWGLRSDVQLPMVPLPAVAEAAAPQRKSVRVFSQEAVPLERLAGLFSSLRQEELDGLPKYRYPSAGGLYPVQAYLFAAPGRVTDLESGLYYYHPREQKLARLALGVRIPLEVQAAHNRTIAEGAAFAVLLVARMSAITPMYGDMARDFALIEAGCMVQLLMTEATRLGLGLCPIGSLDFEVIREHLALHADDKLLHSLWGGTPATAERSEVTPQTLRKHLARFLPAHEIPNSITFLPTLPLTTNQKIDRRALSELAEQAATTVAAGPPGNELERTIVGVWQEFLPGVEMSVHTNFFDLGTNSLTVVRIYNRLRLILNRSFPVVSMFRYPTIRALANYMEQDPHASEVVRSAQARAEQRRQMAQVNTRARKVEK